MNLKSIPNSICELNNLEILYLHNCKKLQKMPDDLGSMEKLEELQLGFTVNTWDLERLPESISFYSLMNLCSLKKLDLSRRQISVEDFPTDFHSFSSLEELHLSANSKLIQLPTSISHLSHLKHLGLNDCTQLQKLNGLPLRIQSLNATRCSALEKIEDLSKEYEWLYKIWLPGCVKLLNNQENERCLDKMLHQSFLQKCAAVGHRFSIAIPGSKIPGWFEEELHGCDIALKLPPKWNSQIMGFAICAVFHGKWFMGERSPKIMFTIEIDGKLIPADSEVDFINAATAATENGNIWITYIPFSFIQNMYCDFPRADWSRIEDNHVMTITYTGIKRAIRCGAQIVYKQDIESIQQGRTSISDYSNVETRHLRGSTHSYIEKYTTNFCSIVSHELSL
uniref:disease resistance protein RPS4-like n=1 Tax=Erigeron canadensis TaxID=72917 RepID=UPI001CB97A87|nr:disease resistance protein RPS4-like [Erigeron canadensis]